MSRIEYIVLIHGTWDHPEPGVPHWTDPEAKDSFASRLVQSLSSSKREAERTWRVERFVWSGRNTHEARVEAGKELFDKVLVMMKADPSARFHFVAHSHGGNVVLAALAPLLRVVNELAFQDCKYVFEECRKHNRDTAAALNSFMEKKHASREELQDFVEYVRPEFESYVSHHGFFDYSEPNGEYGETNHSVFDGGSFLMHARNSEAEPGSSSRGASAPFVQKWFRGYFRNPSTNPLGAIVSLGTPFFVKRWRKAETPAGRLLQGIGRVVTALPVALVWVVALALIVALGVGACSEVSIGDALTFWKSLPWDLLILLVALWTAVVSAGRDPRDLNAYFRGRPRILEARLSRSSKDDAELTYWASNRALCVSCEDLDEVLLVHRSEQLMRRALRPVVRELFRPRWRGQFASIGDVDDRNRLYRQGVGFLRLGIRSVQWLGMRILSWLLGDRPQVFVLDVVCKAVYSRITGIDIDEFRDARLEVSSIPAIPLLEVSSLDATSIVRRDREERPVQARKPSIRVSDTLSERARDSSLLKEIPGWEEPSGSSAIDLSWWTEDHFLAHALASEQVFRKAHRTLGHGHGGYFESEGVLREVADFLAKDEEVRRRERSISGRDLRREWGGGWARES